MEGWYKCNCLPDLVGAEFTDLVCDHSGVNRIARDPRLLNWWQAGDCRCPGLRRRRLATMTRRSWWPQPKISVGDTEWERSKPEPHSPPLYIGINLEVPSETCGNWYKRHQVQHQCGLEMLLLACMSHISPINWAAQLYFAQMDLDTLGLQDPAPLCLSDREALRLLLSSALCSNFSSSVELWTLFTCRSSFTLQSTLQETCFSNSLTGKLERFSGPPSLLPPPSLPPATYPVFPALRAAPTVRRGTIKMRKYAAPSVPSVRLWPSVPSHTNNREYNLDWFCTIISVLYSVPCGFA